MPWCSPVRTQTHPLPWLAFVLVPTPAGATHLCNSRCGDSRMRSLKLAHTLERPKMRPTIIPICLFPPILMAPCAAGFKELLYNRPELFLELTLTSSTTCPQTWCYAGILTGYLLLWSLDATSDTECTHLCRHAFWRPLSHLPALPPVRLLKLAAKLWVCWLL